MLFNNFEGEIFTAGSPYVCAVTYVKKLVIADYVKWNVIFWFVSNSDIRIVTSHMIGIEIMQSSHSFTTASNSLFGFVWATQSLQVYLGVPDED